MIYMPGLHAISKAPISPPDKFFRLKKKPAAQSEKVDNNE